MTNTFNLKEELATSLCEVTFIKNNGDLRVMTCTTSPDIIPKESHPKVLEEGQVARADNPEVQKVYDVNAQGWRSFRWDAVKEAKVL